MEDSHALTRALDSEGHRRTWRKCMRMELRMEGAFCDLNEFKELI